MPRTRPGEQGQLLPARPTPIVIPYGLIASGKSAIAGDLAALLGPRVGSR